MLKPGDFAPNPTLQTIDGSTAPLAQFWQNGRHVVLVFLRHLG